MGRPTVYSYKGKTAVHRVYRFVNVHYDVLNNFTLLLYSNIALIRSPIF